MRTKRLAATGQE